MLHVMLPDPFDAFKNSVRGVTLEYRRSERFAFLKFIRGNQNGRVVLFFRRKIAGNYFFGTVTKDQVRPGDEMYRSAIASDFVRSPS